MTNVTEDKKTWGVGPWLDEPDRKEWKDAATGYPCLAHRNMHGGNWCGYVAVPPGHPAHGKEYDDVDVRVHGGLTYSGLCNGHICHVAEPGEPDDVYWLGFDCHHCDDYAPAFVERGKEIGCYAHPTEEYRTLAYVEGECASLAQQLAAMAA